MAAEIKPLDPLRELAGFDLVRSTAGPFQLFVGEAPIITDSAKSAVAAIDIYTLCALMPDGTLTPYVVATHQPKQAVINTIAVTKIGQATPYWQAGRFNHKAINWPAGTDLDTLDERKALLIGSMLSVGHTI